jgi:hypothetical protein
LQKFIDVSEVIALKMEAAGTSETSVNFCQTIWHYKPEDSHLQMNPVHSITA